MVNHNAVLGIKGVGSEREGLLLVSRLGTAIWKGRAISPDDVHGHVARAVVHNHSDGSGITRLIRSLDRDQLPRTDEFPLEIGSTVSPEGRGNKQSEGKHKKFHCLVRCCGLTLSHSAALV